MSVYKRTGQSIYSYDFRYRGNRFHGSTGETDKRKAEAFERAEKDRIRSSAIDTRKPMTFAAAATLYWSEVGQHLKNDADTWRALGWLQVEIGRNTSLSRITDATVARLVAKRRLEGVSNATVNRSVIAPLRAMMRRASEIWGQQAPSIRWGSHILPEAQERVRELSAAEEARFFAALRRDYHPIFRFALLSGCRMQEILDMTWRDIDWTSRKITVKGKGDKTRRVILTPSIEAMLRPLRDFDGPVFRYASKRADKAPRGAMVPISRNGLKIVHARTCKAAKIEDFRFHDFRHTFATRLMRQCGNIKTVQKALGHTDIMTTARYAHVSDDDLEAAMIATEIATGQNATTEKALKNVGKSE